MARQNRGDRLEYSHHRKTNSIKFTVSFTMHDVATKWKDVTTFQWEPFGENNQVPIGTVTGTVHFPKGVTASNSWTWLQH